VWRQHINSVDRIEDHFVDVAEMIEIGSGAAGAWFS